MTDWLTVAYGRGLASFCLCHLYSVTTITSRVWRVSTICGVHSCCSETARIGAKARRNVYRESLRQSAAANMAFLAIVRRRRRFICFLTRCRWEYEGFSLSCSCFYIPAFCSVIFHLQSRIFHRPLHRRHRQFRWTLITETAIGMFTTAS